MIQKYGGSSVADAERIRRVAARIVDEKRRGNAVVVVVSARGDTTDELMGLAREISPHPPERELAMLLTAGERISMALLGMAITELGEPAVSFTGSQAGIITDNSHTKAKILEVRADRLRAALDMGQVVIVAGFQGVSREQDVTTLGRGGSDLTAVALASALRADVCEIYSDVDGVYTADPRLVPNARKLHAVSYEEMLEMASTGARVLQLRSVEFARNHGVTLHVRSSFEDTPGTWIKEEDERMEQAIISGITHDTSEAKITLLSVPDRPGIAAHVFGALAEADVNVDMIIQNTSEQGHTDISFTLPKEDLAKANRIIDQVSEEIGARGSTCDENIAKVSLVGAGMRTHPGVAAKMFRVLAENSINIEMISTSPIKIACVVRGDQVGQAVRALHEAFNLEEEALAREHA